MSSRSVPVPARAIRRTNWSTSLGAGEGGTAPAATTAKSLRFLCISRTIPCSPRAHPNGETAGSVTLEFAREPSQIFRGRVPSRETAGADELRGPFAEGKGGAVEITGKQPQRHLGRKTSIARKITRRHSTKVGGRFNEVEQLARTGGRQRGMNQSGWKVAAVTVVEEIVGVAERDTKPVCLYM